MSQYTQHFWISPIPQAKLRGNYELLKYEVLCEWSGYYVNVPPKFVFNGTSVPKWLWWFIQKVEADTIKASCLHDRAYTDGREEVRSLFTELKYRWLLDQAMTYRKFVDYHLFYEPMEVDGVPTRKRTIMYLAVRLLWYPVWMKRIK